MAEKHFLTGGLILGFGQRRLDISNLRVDQQYNGDTFDPSLATGEIGLNDRKFFGDISGGLNYHFQNPEKRTRLDIGGSIFHINTPNNSLFDGAKAKLDRRFNIYGITSFKLTGDFDLGLRIIGQFQGPHQETVIGGTLRYHLEQRRSREVAVAFALSHRIGDAWVPTLLLEFHNWSFGLNYDINSSSWQSATARRGGPEFSLIYIFSKVRPPKELSLIHI